MSVPVTYTFARGETISIALDAVTGDPGIVSSVVAKLRPLEPGKRTLEPDADLAATFTVDDRAVSGDIPAGWTLTIEPATSTTLEAGEYLADARITIGTGVETTEGVIIRIYEPATVTDGAGVP